MALFSLQKSIQAKGKLNLVQSGRSKTKLKGWNSSIEGYRLLKWTILKSRIGHIWYVTYPTYYLYVSCQFRPSTLDLSQIVIILPIFYFSQQAKFLHCTTSYRIGIRKVQKISRRQQKILKVREMAKSNMKSKIFQILLQLPSYNKIIDRNEEDLFNLLVENLRLKWSICQASG